MPKRFVRLLFLCLPVAVVLIFTTVSFVIVDEYKSFITNPDDIEALSGDQDISVGIVFGGGVSKTSPLPLVEDRLLAAHDLYKKGIIDTIIVSGDNRFVDYNEPAVMKNYLVETLGIDASDIQEDFADRSTYETCERARKVFGVTSAYLLSEDVHLPRAIYLCRHFGINAYGYPSNATAASGLQLNQRWREIWARDKAVFNVTFIGEKTVLGDQIDL